MTTMKTYTAIVTKADARTKTGTREVVRKDHESVSADALAALYRETYPSGKGYTVEVRETYVLRKNIMGGLYEERFDTPRSCSPASELFWSM